MPGDSPATVREMVQALSFERRCRRRFVHRQSVSEVYLTDGIPVGEAGRFRLGAQWPRQHAFYRRAPTATTRCCSARPFASAPSISDTCTTPYPWGTSSRCDDAHRGTPRPVDHRVVGGGGRHERPGHRTHARRGRPVGVQCRRGLPRRRPRRRDTAGPLAVAGVLTPDDYARIRWSSDRAPTVGRIPQPLPVLQSAVCVSDDRAVVLGCPSVGRHRSLAAAGGSDASGAVRPSLDHVPGVVVLEAARQSARLRLGWSCADVESLELRFRRFLELDEPTTVTTELRPGEDGCVDVEFSQWGEIKASGTIRLAVPLPTVEPAHAFVGLHRV